MVHGRFSLFILAVLMTWAALPAAHAGGEAEKAQATGPATLFFWCGTPEDSGPAQAVSAFEAKHPGIDVVYTRYANDDEGNVKLDIALAAGSNVDVFYSYRPFRLAPRAEKGVAFALTQQLKADSSFNLEKDLGTRVFKWKDEYYALPVAVWLTHYWMNKKMLDQAGLAVPSEWTWSDFRGYAKKLTRGEGTSKVYGAAMMHALKNYWDTPARGLLGGDALYNKEGTSNYDHSAFQKTVELWHDLELVDKTEYPYPEMRAAKTTSPDIYVQGKAAMVLGAPHYIRYASDTAKFPHDFVSALAPVPVFEKGQKNLNNGFFYLDYLSIASSSKFKPQGWEFMKFMAKEGAIEMAPFGRIPAHQALSQQKVADLLLGSSGALYDMDSFRRVMLPYGVEGYNDTRFVAYNQLFDIGDQEMGSVLYGQKTVAAAVGAMKKLGDEAIGKAR